MLLKFAVANHRSIFREIELSLIAVDEDRDAARSFELLNEKVLTVAGLYGPNASGKSNVISAISWLSSAVKSSLRLWENVIPREPFAFEDGMTSQSTFDLDSVVDGVRYSYQLEIGAAGVEYEALFYYPEKRRRNIFEREQNSIKFARGIKGAAGTRELLTPSTLALSAARRFNDPFIVAFAHDVASYTFLGQSLRRRRRGFGGPGAFVAPSARTERWFEEVDQEQLEMFVEDDVLATNRARALALLKMADLGISDVEFEEPEEGTISKDSATSGLRPRDQVRMVHRTDRENASFAFFEESAGTQTWFNLIGPTLTALGRGSVLFFDEIDASLHPTLTAQLIALFQDPTTNRMGAQLIFTTHDTTLLNHLNRDEVWLTEKQSNGMTTLRALSDFAGDRVRRSHNLERGYLQGRFGALPDIDKYQVLVAMGFAGGDRLGADA